MLSSNILNTVAMKNLDSIIPDGTERKWDDTLKQYYVEYSDGFRSDGISDEL